jgi:hypothetical protein
MDKQHKIWYSLLAFSVLLEIWVRWGLLWTTGHDGFFIWPPVDNVMHFFWGANIFLFLILVLRWRPIEGVLGVYGWQMLWELVEMAGDVATAQPPHMLDHFFMDGTKDTLMNITGALFGWFLVSKPLKKQKKYTRAHPRIRRFLTAHLIIMLPMLPIGIFLLAWTGTSFDSLAIAWIVLAVPAALLAIKLSEKRQRARTT